ncbi:SubName: Full=Uncharacterized protein {ECO:0000313/EMBL:CCA72279.1} [Serendipita indica DSM 11827]|nr:SubName: Full=Uncharacterized protein {ECO:0000313/EMBL:CCA72279.1} [Serendipita indica DSM 11827]
MSIRPIEIESLINFHQTVSDVAYDMALVRWLNAVAVALLFYDSLITLPDEVDLIWPKQWSVIKALTYLVIIFPSRSSTLFATVDTCRRHIADTVTPCPPLVALLRLGDPSPRLMTSFAEPHHYILHHSAQRPALHGDRYWDVRHCRFLIITTGYAALVSFAMCNWILLARTKALLGEKRWINTILIIYYVLSYSATAALVTITEIKLYKKMFYSPNLQVCAVAIHPPTMVLRLYNLASWLILPPSFSFTGIFVLWSVLCIAVIRLQLNLIRAVDPRFQPTTVSASSFRGTRNFTNEIHTYNSRARSRDKRLTVGVYTSSSRPPSRRPSLARQEQMQPIQYAPPPLPQHVPYHPDDQTQESEPIQMYDLKNRPYASHTALLGSGADVSVIETQPHIPQERPSHPMTRDYGRESFPSNWYDTPRQSYVQP